jgi:hypothetical protein
MPSNTYYRYGLNTFEFNAFRSRMVSYEAILKNLATIPSNDYYEPGREVPEFEAFSTIGTLGIALDLS